MFFNAFPFTPVVLAFSLKRANMYFALSLIKNEQFAQKNQRANSQPWENPKNTVSQYFQPSALSSIENISAPEPCGHFDFIELF